MVNLPTRYPDTNVSVKKFSKIFAMKKVGRCVCVCGGGGVEREGVGAKINKFS